MPELPEVETVRRGLTDLVSGKEIARVQVLWPKIVTRQVPLDYWCQSLEGQVIHSVKRRAKYLIFDLSQGYLISHLRMEGKYHYYPANQVVPFNKHVHCIFTFTDQSQLHYQDVRKFGRFEWVNQADLTTYFIQKGLGPEPTWAEFKLNDFRQGLAQSQRAIKPLLLDQKLVVGLGNIYVDEALFQAGIHPMRPANSLKAAEIDQLHQAIIKVLATAVEAGGSSIRTYLNSLGEAGTFQTALAVYGRKDQPCLKCGRPIKKIQFAQRGTHFCSYCQPLDSLGEGCK